MLEKPLEKSFEVIPEFENAREKEVAPESAGHVEDAASKVQEKEESTELSEQDVADLKDSEKMAKVVARVFAREFSGPIPSPDIMADYENIMPGATDRIIAMAE